ncbi:MAX dimerization protein MGA a isoform X3 [Poecilia latipinna]|uniref:MAX dimerization protein MGA a isoform X3 n=1 Tax=Poecilia latipinna TaxID=48699 RepID=UPI00072E0235|nr:PREDICTED: uncharacterized protein LOC106959769 isoform X3 [Poecilia latipinna]
MASSKTRQGMVILKEGATAPAAAPMADHSSACLVAVRAGKVQSSGTVQGVCVSTGEANISGKHKMYPAKEAIMKMGELKHPACINSPSDVLSPDCVCKDVKVTLDNNVMWNEFYKCRTEMILTKQGSRMFPYCRFRVTGLQSSRKYSLVMDVEPLDNSQYRWTGESWQVCRKAERHVRSKPFVHPDSPATGQHWMQSPVSFYRLKLTNNTSDQEGNIILHPMHRYLPQLHVVQADKAIEDFRLNGPNVLTFTFPQTEFITVTTYQNPQFTQLKVNYNPFVKKLKEDRVNTCGLRLKGNAGKDSNSYEGKTNTEQHPVKKSLKILLANHKPRNSKALDVKLPPPKEPQEKSTMSNTQPAATTPVESPSSSSRPVPKLISELICEAHVSLQRCHKEQLCSNNSNSSGAAQGNTTSTTLTDRLTKPDIAHKKNGSVATFTRKSSTVEKNRNIKDNEHLSNSNSIADVRTVCSSASPIEEEGSLNKSHQQCNVGAELDGVKQQKRPARLPLPALALFLKQHSTKSKKANNTPESAPQAPLPESCCSPSPAAAPHQETSIKPIMEDCGGNRLLPDEKLLNVTEQAAETNPSHPSGPDLFTASDVAVPDTKAKDPFITISECLSSESTTPDHKALISNSENTFDSLEMSALTLSSSSTSGSPDLSLHLSTALSLPDSPKAAAESSTLPSGSRSLKIDSLLPDPQCSSFDFDPLSPASSPEPLPPLPASLALELDSATSAAASTPDLQHCRNSSVFKWHTVLPLSGTYANPSFTTLQPQQQSTPVMSVTSPLLSCLPEPQSVISSTQTTPKDSIPSFQDSEQSLPFPAELSPLALQLPLSPTFSSLDEDGLSPTTSIAELVHFFSIDDDIGVEFSNTDTAAVTSQPLPVLEPPRPSVPVLPVSSTKPCKRKKSTKLARLELGQAGNEYRSKQPKVEEVEEQLFVSFTSKEALKLHTAESSEELLPDPELTPDPKPDEEADDSSSSSRESLEETIAVHEETLLRDLKLMKHRQVIHPVLQEVGLKMTLLDPALSIDLQYLGVSLPIPLPGVVTEPLTQTTPTSQGVFASFQSRTGKTTDLTQIKGWKEKFTSSEVESASAPKPEAGPSADLPKKNLSAFCSDMLDEYLESEGKLIDERASSFSQPPAEAPSYRLPVSSTSYVRTLDHILKKPSAGSPASDIISGFIPPSKRSRLKESAACRRAERKPRGPKPNRIKAACTASDFPTAVQLQYSVPGSLTSEPLNGPAFTKRRRLKPRASSQTLSVSTALNVSEEMAPLESDSELKPDSVRKQPSDHSVDGQRKESRVTVTRTYARLKELEDSVVLEGRFQTSISTERATIALMSLFTQTGFVRENPTSPIKLRQRQAVACLNEFCRLGCVCSSLSHCSRISHCGRPLCMFGCSCLKQKMVLLKNLDSSDASPSPLQCKLKKKRRRMMKMAYVLKEAETVAHPAERVRTLWRKDADSSDPEPVHAPDVAPFLQPPSVQVRRKYRSSCARVRSYIRKTQKQKEEESKALISSKDKTAGLKVHKHGEQGPTQTNVTTPRPPSADADKSPSASPPGSSEALCSKPSKRLMILADCKWVNDSDRSYVLKKLCEAMAQDQLDKPFWIKNYLITPIDETVDETSGNRCIEYKVQISTPILDRKKAPAKKPVTRGKKRGIKPAAQHRQDNRSGLISKNEKAPKRSKNMMNQSFTDSVSVESVEDWQKEVMEEEPMEEWQKEVMKEEEEELMEDCQMEVMVKDKPMEDWQKKVKVKMDPLEQCQKEVMEKTELMKDWQKKLKVEVEAMEDFQKEVTPTKNHLNEVETIKGFQKEAESTKDFQKKAESTKDFQKKAESTKDFQKKAESTKDFQKKAESTKDFQKKAESIKDFGKKAESKKDFRKKAESIKDFQKEVVYIDECQKEGREDYMEKNGEGFRRYKARHELKRSTEGLNSHKKRRTGMSLPFPLLVGLSPSGFLSANKKKPGGPDDVIQVNGKQYPLAKIKLGRMGALHPANRLAAYLTGRVGSTKQRQSSSSSEPSCNLQSIPHVTSSVYCVPPAPAASTVAPAMVQSQPPTTQPTLATPSSDSEPQNVVVGPPNPPQNSTPPQPLLIQVPNPPNVAAPLLPPRITQFPAQRMVLKPVRSSAGVQYYRKPDGTLVQLIPTSQLRPGNPSATIHGGNSEPQNLVGGPPNPPQNLTTPTDPQPLLIQLPNPPKVVNLLQPRITQFPGQRMVLKPVRSSAGVQYYRKPDGALVQLITSNLPRSGNPPATVPGGDRSASCAQLPPVAAVKRPALTNLSSSSSVVLPLPSPGASSSSSNPPIPPSVFLSPQNTCTFRIVPPHRVKDPIFIQLPFLPPTQIVGSERGIIQLQGPSQPVNYTPPDPLVCEKKDIPVERHNDSPQTLLTVQTADHRGASPPTRSPPPEPTLDCLGPKEEFAFDPMDLNVVFVDEVVDLVSSSETEDSSDFRESDSEDEKNQNAKRSKGDLKKKKKQLRSRDENQSVLPPTAAGQAAAARTEVQSLIYISSEEESPKRKTVTNGAAAAAAGELTGDGQLGTGLQEAWSGTLENLERNSGCEAVQQQMEMTINSDLEAEGDSRNSQRTQINVQHHESNASCRKHRAQMKQTFLQLKREVLPADDSMSRTSLLEKAVQVIQELRSCEEDLKRKKRSLVRRRDEFLSILAPSAGDGQLGTGLQEAWSGTLENLEGNSGCGVAQQQIEMTINSDLESEVDSPISPGTEQLGQAPQEVQKLPTEAESLWSNQSLKKEDNKDAHTEDVCSTPGTETLQHLLTNQKQPEMEGRQQTTNDVPVEGVLCVAIPTGVAGPLQAPPAAVQLQPLRQPVLHVSDGAPAPPDTKRIKTVPNILSRSRNRDLPQKMSAEKAPPMDKVPFAAPPGSTPHRTQELQPLLAAAPPAFLLVSAEPSQMGVPLPRLPPQALALPPQGPAPPPCAPVPPPGLPYPPLDIRQSDPAGQMARQDSDNESLSSLLSEIVFLNQQTVATATTAVIDPPVVGGSEEQKHASEHPGPILGNANEGVLAPPPLLHMKVGGAKEARLGSNNEATVGGAGAVGVAWRPMPRLVPLGLRGNSPS